MNNFSLSGTIHKIFDTEQKSESFSTRNFVLKYDGDKYPQLIQFQLTQANVVMLDTYREGDTVTVHFNVHGREWKGRFFTNLTAYKIERTEIRQSPDKPPNDLDFSELENE